MAHYDSGTFFLRNATEFATKACDDFFAWVADFDGDLRQVPRDRFKTLFAYFEAWTEHKKDSLDCPFSDGSEELTWEAFSPLLPCIYIGIIDRLLVDPTLLDYKRKDPVLFTEMTVYRPMRRVSYLDREGDNHQDNMDRLLDWVRLPQEDGTSRRYPPTHSLYEDINDDDYR